jgi:DNA repair exonuclease SbcCD ATPase subunit
MIQTVRAENWKVYKRLELELWPGTTFVVAKNGIGKTSLIQAVAWGLFGETHTSIDHQVAIRRGEEETTVSLGFLTHEGDLAEITRTARIGKKTSDVSVTMSGEKKRGQSAIDEFLLGQCNAEAAFLARMSVLGEGSVVGQPDVSLVFNLESHLLDFLGLTNLAAAARVAGQLESAYHRQLSSARSARRQEATERARIEERREQLVNELDKLQKQRTELSALVERARGQLARSQEWHEWEESEKQRESDLVAILQELSESLQIEVEGIVDIDPALKQEQARLLERLELARQGEADATGRERLVRELLARLKDKTVCPICRRPIGEEEARHAEEAHEEELADLRRRGSDAVEERRGLEKRLARIDALSERLFKVPSRPKPSEPTPSMTLDEVKSQLADFERQFEAILERIGESRNEKMRQDQLLARDDEAIKTAKVLEQGYRREALAGLAKSTFEQLTRQFTEQEIQPLASELAERWKLLWQGRPSLRLLPTGGIVGIHDGFEIPYSELSGGEKSVALLLVRLLTLALTTQADFVWLDEPLEHLDPRNRRVTAALLVRATQGGPFHQILVTTYEESVARRLADQAENARLQYVTSDPQ